jgi:hypothetical protein
MDEENIVMKRIAAIILMSLMLAGSAFAQKTYNHASEYQVAVLDESTRIGTGADATLGKTSTDAKLNGGGQGFHFLHTDHGNYRVEAPVNKGMSFMAAMAAPGGTTPVTYHNKWFLDNTPAGTNVLFAAQCGKANKKHPNDVVRCEFWFPDPDSTSHEYRTMGDFTPYLEGNGSNIQNTANSLCGKGKLSASVETQVCNKPAADQQPSPAAEVIQPDVAQPAAAVAQPPVQPVVAPSVAPVVAITPATAVATPVLTPAVQEVSLGEAAKRNKQHAACLKLAADNASITCQ